MEALTPFAWRLKFGGALFDSHSSNYSHSRSLFAYYNDASTMDAAQTTGSLKHRYSQSESEMSTFYTRLSGNIPSVDKMFFNIQYSRGSIKDNSYDPVTKDGYVIMYADKITDSMKKTIDETERRRKLQEIHNKKNNITPTTIQKNISDILEMVEKSRASNPSRISTADLNIKEASKKDLVKISKNIEQEMKLAADLLEFELAARLRDELKDLRREIQEIVE